MPKPPAENGDRGRPNLEHGDPGEAFATRVNEMAEPLTAISNYLAAAIRLHNADTSAARAQLGRVLEQTQAQASRADAILRHMRHLLLRK